MSRENQASIVDWHRGAVGMICASEQAAVLNERFASLLTEWAGPSRRGFLMARVVDAALATYLLADLRGVALTYVTYSAATVSFWLDTGSKHASRIVRASNKADWADVDGRLQPMLNALAALADHFGADLGQAVDERMASLRRQAEPQRMAG